MVRNAMLAASSRRALIGCATCTTWPPASVLNTRQCAALGVDGGEAELRVLRQHAVRLRQIQLHAVAVPDLHQQRIAAGPERRRRPARGANGASVSDAAISFS